MMRYVVINPCNGYVYKGNGFLVILGYGGTIGAGAGIGNEVYLEILNAQSRIVHECYRKTLWTDGSALTSNANLNSGTSFCRGIMVNGYSIASAPYVGYDIATAVECDTLEEAAQLL